MVSRFILNQIGLELGAAPKALVDVTDGFAGTVELVSAAGWTRVAELSLGPVSPGFRGRSFAAVDLGEAQPGRYILRLREEKSAPFVVGTNLLWSATTDAVLGYFRSQRCALDWEQQDRQVGFVGGRTDQIDVSGGWYDASGDVSKYLSHLSYANFMNPQQTPIVVWGLLEHLERVDGDHAAGNAARLLDEARHGADFLCRMQDPEGYFYMTVFDQWSKFPERRVICSYQRQTGELLPSYQAGYRQGGGATIAALARAGRLLDEPRYKTAAARGFAHLEEHNRAYLDDGHENVIDDYCALLGATELFAATAETRYLDAARVRARGLVARIRSDGPMPGWLRADDGDRPFCHAAEAGLPVVALLRLAELDSSERHAWRLAAESIMRFELAVTREVDNPYGLARQFVQDLSGHRRTSFFIPHQNETGYWWQGENARLASLAAAAGSLARVTENPAFGRELRAFAFDQLDWICGKNPFNSCMLHGFGLNNMNYMDLWPNVPGGICNGITSSFEDESDVDFGRTDVEGDHSWRWFEQWLPHSSWFLIALAELYERRLPSPTKPS